MNYIRFYLRNNHRYSSYSNNDSLSTLGNFLTDDIGCSKDSVENRINFINDPNRE